MTAVAESWTAGRTAGGARWTRHPIRLAIVVLGAGLPVVLGNYALHLAVTGGLMAVAALALTVLTGTAGLLSLGHAAFLAIGAFSAGLLAMGAGLGLLPALAVAILLGTVVGGALAVLTLRVSGLYLAVGTFALHHVVTIVATDLDVTWTIGNGFALPAPSLFGLTIDSELRWWGLTLILLGLVHAGFAFLLRGHVGRAWVVLREDATAAAALGISMLRSRAAVFMLTSAVTSGLGVFWAYHIGNVQAGHFSIHVAVMYLTIIALGRPGNLIGAILASYAMLLLPVAIQSVLLFLSVDPTSRLGGIENIVIAIILAVTLLDGPARIGRRLRRAIHVGP